MFVQQLLDAGFSAGRRPDDGGHESDTDWSRTNDEDLSGGHRARWASFTPRRSQKIDGVEVVSIASRTEESGEKFAEEWKIPFTSTSLEACIDRPGVDAVILTTPSDQHATRRCSRCRKGKHVQVEIPMALNLPDSRSACWRRRRRRARSAW